MDIDRFLQTDLPFCTPSLIRIHHPFADIRMLRLDLIHPTLSGNKLYKLRYNVQAFQRSGKSALLSFGGAHSNHLHALACLGHLTGIPTIGIVRGELHANPTLTDCLSWGMQLFPISREHYRDLRTHAGWKALQAQFPECYIIPEGGDNPEGRKGCREILQYLDLSEIDMIALPLGTGTTLLGVSDALPPDIRIKAYCAMKQGEYLQETLSDKSQFSNWSLVTDHHFGGFGKRSQALISFCHQFMEVQGFELDGIYTGKMMAGLFHDLETGSIAPNTRILALHTGGLQGNRSGNEGL